MAVAPGVEGEQDPDGAGAKFLEVRDRRAVDGVDKRSAEPGAGVGEDVDGLHDARVGGSSRESIQSRTSFDEVDLPLAGCHRASIPIAKLGALSAARGPGIASGSPGAGDGGGPVRVLGSSANARMARVDTFSRSMIGTFSAAGSGAGVGDGSMSCPARLGLSFGSRSTGGCRRRSFRIRCRRGRGSGRSPRRWSPGGGGRGGVLRRRRRGGCRGSSVRRRRRCWSRPVGDRRFDAVVVGEFERAFTGGQFQQVAGCCAGAGCRCGCRRQVGRSIWTSRGIGC